MDRNYYYQKLSQEHQRDLSRKLAVRQMLKQADGDPVPPAHPKRMVLMGVPAVVAVVVLVLLQVL